MVTLYRSLISFFPSSIIICITNFNNNKRKQIHIQSLYKHAFLDRREPVPSFQDLSYDALQSTDNLGMKEKEEKTL